MKERERDYSQGRAVMENVCHLSTEKVEAEGSEARSSSLGYVRPCQKEGMGREKKANSKLRKEVYAGGLEKRDSG